jgi:Mg/Co/Ni transporter MgtE
MTMARTLLQAFASEDPDRFAALLGSAQGNDEVLAVLGDIAIEYRADVISRLALETADRVLKNVDDTMLVEWLAAGTMDASRRMLLRVESKRAQRLIDGISDRTKRRGLRRLSSYPSGTIGELVQIHSISIKADATIDDINTLIHRHSGALEGPIAIERHDGTLMGVLDLTKFVQNRNASANAADFCIRVAPVYADSPLPSLQKSPAWNHSVTIPVVEHEQRLIGYISRSTYEQAICSKGEGTMFFEAIVEITNQFWAFLTQILVLLLDRRAK